ncbi:ABC transporter permease [Lysobacter sp. CAU 1642]|uniref:Transport permease protein n=2 Tax=Pseudomarimonas salicorniae TaxID=2933270 RepID=A0ABT0GIT0_9GAMM|nr:ABC transporter permease [Lysobacter sp. CAU 1642]MCK7594454.1 ABC transporter permease [Lysobacter sp. CAU 1642]
MFRALWAYRGYVLGAVVREFQLKYRGSVLGVLWPVLNPLAMILVFTLVFAAVMKPSLPGQEANPFAYSVYLCSGVLTWGLFAEMLTRLNTVFIENGNLLKKSSFPRICLPVIVTLSALLNFSIVLGLFVAFLFITDNFPGAVALGFFPVLAVQILFTLGLGLLTGTLNVFFRDVGQFVGICLQFWFWLTPIVYVATILPAPVAGLLEWNPMWHVIDAYHRVFSEQAWPDLTALIPLAIGSLMLLVLAGITFLRLAPEMVDEL